MDKALRLWNFLDKSSELISFFQDSPLAVSFHPSGLYLVVAFGEKVRVFFTFSRYFAHNIEQTRQTAGRKKEKHRGGEGRKMLKNNKSLLPRFPNGCFVGPSRPFAVVVFREKI